MFPIFDAYVQTAPAAGGATDGLMSFLPVILMFMVLWSVIVRPQMKHWKEVKAVLEVLAKDDEVTIAGSILDKVNKVAEQYVVVKIAASTEITMQRNAMTTVLPKGMFEAL